MSLMQLSLNNLYSTGNEECVNFLIQNGATINIKDSDGKDPLQLAIDIGMLMLYKFIKLKFGGLNLDLFIPKR